MKRFVSRISFLFTPFAIGIYITFAIAWSSHLYFQSRNKPTENLSPVEAFLNLAHQKSIDFRLKQRGERQGSQDVALLNVDEKALEIVGMWPWPREILARAVDNAANLGAKVIVFDMVFPESSPNPSADTFNEVSQKITLSPQVKEQFAAAIKERDSDVALAKILAKHSEHIVQGGFGTLAATDLNYPGHTESCYELISSLSRENEFLIKKEKSLIVSEQRPQIPETLKAFYENHLHQIEELLSEGPPPKNSVEKRDLRMKILGAQTEFCNTWLDPKEDPTYKGIAENWAAVVEADSNSKFLPASFDEWAKNFKSESKRNSVPRVISWTINNPAFTQFGDAFNTGFFNTHLDADGAIRRTNLILRTGTSQNTYLPAIALKAFLVANNFNARIKLGFNKLNDSDEIENLEIIDKKGEPVFSVPVDSGGRLAINFAGRQKMFPHVSLADLLTDSDELTYEVREFDAHKNAWVENRKTVKKAAFFKDKIFILGATAIGIYDLRVTPFEENYPGVETQANILDNLIRRDFLANYPQEEMYMLGVILAIGLIHSFCLSYFGALFGLSLSTALIAAFVLLDKYFLFGHGMVVTIILPIGLVLLLFLFLTSYKYFTEERGKKELRSTFQKYVSPAIVEEILSDPSKVELGGRKAQVTIFFSDVRGFTTISEKLDPHALSELLNRYLTPMTELVFQTKGTLDKYMGDAIMAFFGAPITYKDHAQYACRCALLTLEKLSEIKKEFVREGLPEIDIGIGINTGEVSVGNMGSKTVRSYTVMGDAVNLASRLESTNKQYGTRILVSEFTYAEIKNDFTCREIDRVLIRGKAQPVKIFELICEGPADQRTQENLKFFYEGYELYHNKNWADAHSSFKKALDINPDDPVSKIYVERCTEFLIAPPAENWDGVYSMKTN